MGIILVGDRGWGVLWGWGWVDWWSSRIINVAWPICRQLDRSEQLSRYLYTYAMNRPREKLKMQVTSIYDLYTDKMFCLFVFSFVRSWSFVWLLFVSFCCKRSFVFGELGKLYCIKHWFLQYVLDSFFITIEKKIGVYF